MKKFLLILLLFSCFVFTACTKDFYDVPSGTISLYLPSENIFLAYPKNWQSVGNIDSDTGFQVVLGYFNPTPSSEGYFSNFTILKTQMENQILSEKYAEIASKNLLEKIIGYKKEIYESYEYIDYQDVKTGYIHVYTGKESFRSPEFRYVQVYLTKSNFLYVATFTLPLDEPYDDYLDILKFIGFSSKDPFNE